MPEDALHKSAAASNENRVSKAPSQDSGRSTDGWVEGEDDATASAQSSLKSESLTKTAFDGELLAGSNEMHSQSVIAAPGGAQAISTRLPDDPWSVGYTPAPLPEELEPSRKIETPDMLRWRAEMLLDEMMVGAVDVSAGEGTGWRTSPHADTALLLDEHPRIEPRTASTQTVNQADLHSPVALQTAVTEQPNTTDAPVAEVPTVDKAAVRAALPPRSVTRMPTPIGRNGESVAANGAPGTQTNGYPANGHGAHGNGNHENAADLLATVDAAEIDALEGDVADDGRPIRYPNCDGGGVANDESGRLSNGTGAANGAAPRSPVRIDDHPERPESPPSNGRIDAGAMESLQDDSSVNGAAGESAMGYSMDSPTSGLARQSMRRSTPAPMVDPLEDLNANPPLPVTPAQHSATVPPAVPASGSISAATSIVGASAFVPSSPAKPYTPSSTPRAPQRTTGSSSVGVSGMGVSSNSAQTAESESTLSLAAQYSAYAPAPSPSRQPEPPPAPVQPVRTESKGKLTAVEQRYARPVQPNASSLPQPSTGVHNDALPNEATSITGGLGPVRINPAVLNSASVTGAMSVGSRANSRYASLLPRATPWDLHEMEREIVALQEEMARFMPQGHESTRRARHLLEKAQTIFVNDPLRSAEVDYYLTQVKAIVQRSHQTLEWSERYRRQLIRYHWAWIGFSALMLTLCVLFGTQLQTWAVSLFGISETGLIARNLVPAAVAIFAGSLGASVGALFTIRRYHRLDLGYFDRKYSLRGLMLPIIGLLGGLVFHAIFASLYWAMGVNTPLPLALEILPAALAFLLGFVQESVYGTRD